jgi:hypothetical protein
MKKLGIEFSLGRLARNENPWPLKRAIDALRVEGGFFRDKICKLLFLLLTAILCAAGACFSSLLLDNCARPWGKTGKFQK